MPNSLLFKAMKVSPSAALTDISFTWDLTTPGQSQTLSAPFTSATVKCAPITPVGLCTDDVNTLQLGYKSGNTFPITVPIGPGNTFVPDPKDRKQPVLFMPGDNSNAFKVTFPVGENWLWTVVGSTLGASATSQTKPVNCSTICDPKVDPNCPSCVEKNQKDELLAIDQNAANLRQVILDMARRGLKTPGITAAQSKSFKKAMNDSDVQYNLAWVATWANLEVVNQCTGDTATTCAVTTVTQPLEDYKVAITKLKKIADSTYKQFNKVLRVKSSPKYRKRIDQTYSTAQSGIADVATVTYTCPK